MDKVCKKCGHSCHCMEGNHTECQCKNCDCKTEVQPVTNNEVIVDDTTECEWC